MHTSGEFSHLNNALMHLKFTLNDLSTDIHNYNSKESTWLWNTSGLNIKNDKT